MGYSSGFCLKKVSRFLAFGLGSIFIIVQAMSYNGYIKVNYDGIQKDIEVIIMHYIIIIGYGVILNVHTELAGLEQGWKGGFERC